MTTVKADINAADRALKRACKKTVQLIREGRTAAECVPVLVAAGIAADLLLEEPA